MLLQSPLHDRHVALGAKFAEFGGWEMPIEYAGAGVIKEHTAVREAVGIFDVSHLGKAMVTGPGAADFVNSTLSNDLRRISPGQAQYTLCLDDATGGIVDDLIVYFHDEEHILLVPNAANTTEVVRRLAEAAHEGITVRNLHQDYAVIAVQGPKSDETLAAIGFPVGHDYMSFVEAPFEGAAGELEVVVCRTGYTGERGYELIAKNEIAAELWDRIVAAGAEFGLLACGLGSRDTLRTEMGYPLHGQDISLDTTPNEGGIGWAVGWKKPAFWGRSVVVTEKEAGPKRVLRGIVAVGRGIPRSHQQAFLSEHVAVGEVTSGTFSPTLKKGIGMALVSTVVNPEAQITVDVRGRREIFQVTKPPFVESHVREA
ncbi:glycine cleavage system aminomethyltransferase GcvT [Nocardioides sp. Kera G14]|uniref:glycine cleavage system aminomethyltransferase GcvT n=1 Tax=Nocardioides sp. Kera G14 TaxID=2884264 RepID=UPI001D11FB46|nr:glycine cleavage system aminomethyltransferase GcvT [Nocardioides sp. Kera G14]UDY25055.1 glycine cleavage system aminomethyltransferase GcvT [Nocardioides sp. Kera G14]